jgi:hypothetical protein
MNTNNEVVAYAQTTIKLSARKLIGKCGITSDDLEDIKSEMMLDVLERLPRHNQDMWSYKTFIPQVIRHKVHHILRDRCRQKEIFWGKLQSLEELFDTEFDGNTVEISFKNKVYDHSRLCSDQLFDLKLDLKDVISGLTDIQRQCCLAILDGKPLSRIAENNGIPRGTFYKNVINPIREAFKKAGLKDYIS